MQDSFFSSGDVSYPLTISLLWEPGDGTRYNFLFVERGGGEILAFEYVHGHGSLLPRPFLMRLEEVVLAYQDLAGLLGVSNLKGTTASSLPLYYEHYFLDRIISISGASAYNAYMLVRCAIEELLPALINKGGDREGVLKPLFPLGLSL